MAARRDPSALLELFEARTVISLDEIRECLGGVSSMTAFRYLRLVPYRRSYNHNGKLYARHDVSRYDRYGLWSSGDGLFSIDGSLRATVRRLVYEAKAGATNRELQDRLRVRVQHTLLDLLRKGEVERERVTEVYVYLHTEASVRKGQLQARREEVAARTAEVADGSVEVSAEVVIQVLLKLIRHRGSGPGAIARRLRGHAPPIRLHEVEAVFTRYELGEKGGSSIC